MNWFKLYNHLKIKTQLALVSETEDYRKLARELPNTNDTVLEVGCSFGLATVYLSASAKEVLAIDHSITQLTQSEEQNNTLENVEWLNIDARDISEIKLKCPAPDIIFMDIGGNIQLGNIASVLRLYLNNFTPRIFVIKSIELAIIHQLIHSAKLPVETAQLRNTLNPKDQRLENLLSLSHSEMLNDRVFAARQLHRLNDAAAKARLVELSQDTNAKVRRIASNVKETSETISAEKSCHPSSDQAHNRE